MQPSLTSSVAPWHRLMTAKTAAPVVNRMPLKSATDDHAPAHCDGWLALQDQLGCARLAEDGELLLHRGEQASELLVLIEGAVEFFQQSAEGMAKVFRISTGPTTVGAMEILGGESSYLASARALGSVVYYSLKAIELRSLLKAHPALVMTMLADSSKMACAGSRFESAALCSTECHLATLLSAYAELFGQCAGAGKVQIMVRRSQSQLALSIGAGERSVNRILAHWQRAGWIYKRSGVYVLAAPLAIRQLAAPLHDSLIHRGCTRAPLA